MSKTKLDHPQQEPEQQLQQQHIIYKTYFVNNAVFAYVKQGCIAQV